MLPAYVYIMFLPPVGKTEATQHGRSMERGMYKMKVGEEDDPQGWDPTASHLVKIHSDIHRDKHFNPNGQQ